MPKVVMRILISDASSYKAVVIAKYIKIHYKDIEVYTCDLRINTKFLHTKYSDKHYVLSCASVMERDYIVQIAKLCDSEHIDLYLPVNSKEMGTLLSNRDLCTKLTYYWGSYDSFVVMNNKNKLYNFARLHSIRVPVSYDSVESAVLPFVFKPAISSSAHGVVYVFTEKQRQQLLKSGVTNTDAVIQEYIAGTGIGYSAFVKDGSILKGYGHIRLAEYPATGGSSTYRNSFNDSRIEEISARLFHTLNWSGFAMVEFKLTPKQEIVLIEINPRIWGSINQGLQNSMNYFEPLLGTNSEKLVTPLKETRTYLSPLVYISMCQYLIKGNFKMLLEFLVNIKNNRADISIIDDPFGYLGALCR